MITSVCHLFFSGFVLLSVYVISLFITITTLSLLYFNLFQLLSYSCLNPWVLPFSDSHAHPTVGAEGEWMNSCVVLSCHLG